MWWRFLTFCVLVTVVLFVVLSCIQNRPVLHLFFQRCCEENIENDQVIFENFGNNFLRERLVGADVIEADAVLNGTVFPEEEVKEVMEELRKVMINVHDPRNRNDVIEPFGT